MLCRVLSFLQNLNVWQFFKICNLLCLGLTWDLMLITSMGNHGTAGVSQNAGVLVLLVYSVVLNIYLNIMEDDWELECESCTPGSLNGE